MKPGPPPTVRREPGERTSPKNRLTVMIDKATVNALDEWRDRQPVQMTRQAVIRFAIDELLRTHDGFKL